MAKFLPSLLALVLGVALGILALATPAPAAVDASGFSALRAFADVKAVGASPHPVTDQESLQRVRDYLRGRFRALGLEPSTLRYPPLKDGSGREYPLENIAARIPGKSGRSLLLVAHYDSAPPRRGGAEGASRGAADDGYGLATLLEVAGLLSAAKEPLQNGVAFLFTDAEETGLRGARSEMESDAAAWGDIDFVVNLEARGIRGPAVMFETGRNNAKTIELYRSARFPFAYSFAVDVYRAMPNGTDFTVFLRKGLAGVNFSVLDDLSYYHTARDNPANVSLSSLQHYGEQIVPIVMKYARDGRYSAPGAFASGGDMTYFSWLPGIFVSYPAAIASGLSVAAVLLFLLWAVTEARAGRLRAGRTLLWTLAWLLFALGALALGLAASLLFARIAGLPWKFTYLPGLPGYKLIPWLFLALELGAAWLLARRGAAGRGDRGSVLAGGLILDLVFLGLSHLFLPGGTFLFALPVLVGLGSASLARVLGRPRIGLVAVSLVISLYLPVLALLDLALTAGALGLLLFVAALPLALLGPLLVASVPPGRGT